MTLYEFATPNLIESLLIKERIKCCKHNRRHTQKGGTPFQYENYMNESTDDLVVRTGVDFLMPPRRSWIRRSKEFRSKIYNSNSLHNSEIARIILANSLRSTIKRDRKILQSQNNEAPKRLGYLNRLDNYIEKIRNLLKERKIKLHTPEILYILKKKNDLECEYRPIAIYNNLDDKIILSITSKYLAQKINDFLHDEILSYRPARVYHNKEISTDFNTGIKSIGEYRKNHDNTSIYAADCDIQKFYDTINHDIVIKCFERILNRMKEKEVISDEGKSQIICVLNAYLSSYDFYHNVFLKTLNGVPGKAKLLPQEVKSIVKWISEKDMANCYGSKEKFINARNNGKIGVPQGGSLSLLIANIVLNDVDINLLSKSDKELFLCRFCDDMVLLHPEYEKCEEYLNIYAKELTSHHLVYHNFTRINELKSSEKTIQAFWDVKSHSSFLWGNGENGNNWIGFLGYEMKRNGAIRLRMSNVKKLESGIKRKYHILTRTFYKLCANYHGSTINEQEFNLFYNKLQAAIKSTEISELFKSYIALNNNCFIIHQKQRINYYRRLFFGKLMKKVIQKAYRNGFINEIMCQKLDSLMVL